MYTANKPRRCIWELFEPFFYTFTISLVSVPTNLVFKKQQHQISCKMVFPFVPVFLKEEYLERGTCDGDNNGRELSLGLKNELSSSCILSKCWEVPPNSQHVERIEKETPDSEDSLPFLLEDTLSAAFTPLEILEIIPRDRICIDSQVHKYFRITVLQILHLLFIWDLNVTEYPLFYLQTYIERALRACGSLDLQSSHN